MWALTAVRLEVEAGEDHWGLGVWGSGLGARAVSCRVRSVGLDLQECPVETNRLLTRAVLLMCVPGIGFVLHYVFLIREAVEGAASRGVHGCKPVRDWIACG